MSTGRTLFKMADYHQVMWDFFERFKNLSLSRSLFVLFVCACVCVCVCDNGYLSVCMCMLVHEQVYIRLPVPSRIYICIQARVSKRRYSPSRTSSWNEIISFRNCRPPGGTKAKLARLQTKWLPSLSGIVVGNGKSCQKHRTNGAK